MESLQERVQAYWDKRSADFSAVRQKELKGIDGAAWLDYIRKFLPCEGTLDVLDIGTGPGFLAILMAAAGHRAVGMDMSPLMLKEAKKTVKTMVFTLTLFSAMHKCRLLRKLPLT